VNEPIIQSLLDLDLYKISMALHAYHYFPDTEVRYGFTNRSSVDLANIIDPDELEEELEHVRTLSLSEDEKQYVGNLSFFKNHPDFVDLLMHPALPPVEVIFNEKRPGESFFDDDEDAIYNYMLINAEGRWFPTILWETIILSVVNELYFRKFATAQVLAEGRRRVYEKIEFFRANPQLLRRLIEFGTRRRFSREWQAEVLRIFLEEIPDYFLGTSNVKLAMENGIKPIGTMAHEILMFYDAYFGNAESQSWALTDWYNLFGDDLSIGLTDTFGSDFYFSRLLGGAARMFKGHRQDSGDPHEWTRKMLEACARFDIDASSLISVYSDGLTPPKMVEIADAWIGKVNPTFGWGTNATNDLGLKALSMVVKMTHVKYNGIWMPTVKLSDNMNKAIGPDYAIRQRKKRYGHTHDNREECVY